MEGDRDRQRSVELTRRGIMLRVQGRLDAALEEFNKALDIDPANTDALNNKGCVLGELAGREMALGECYETLLEEALACFDRALEVNPEDGETWSNKGNALLLAGNLEESIECHDRASELTPDSSAVWFNKGLAMANANYYSDALRCFDRAVEIDPNNKQAWLEKYYIHRRWDEIWEMSDCVANIERIEEEEK